MKRAVAALTTLLLAGVYVGRSTRGEEAPKEKTYIGVYYCLNSQAVLDERKSGKQEIVVGTSLPSLNPDSNEFRACAKTGVPTVGYVQITPPFSNLNDEKK
ncbi:MAG: hypothetical protein ACRD50_01985 [Candidatus Acidiferrales bacterium]